MNEIIEKLDNLTKAISEKDIIINDLVDKIKIIEEKLIRKEEISVDNGFEETETETEINTLGFQCEICDFNGKTKQAFKHTFEPSIRKVMKIELPTTITK